MMKPSLSQCVLFDWGNTVMRDFAEFDGPMHAWPRVETMPGIRAALKALRPASLIGLATNAEDSGPDAIRRALERCDLSAWFDTIFCSRDLGHRKPDAGFFRAIIGSLGLPPGTIYMVGDDFRRDVLAANASGIRGVWYNRITEKDRSGPLHRTVRRLEDLPSALAALGLGLERRRDGEPADGGA